MTLTNITGLTREQIEEKYRQQRLVERVRRQQLYKKRESKFTQQFANRLCRHVGNGGTVASFLRDWKETGEYTPTYPTVLQWMRKHPKFRERYELAQQARAERMSDELIDIADDSSADYDEDGRFKGEAVQRSKLKIETRKYLMSKLAPHKYGEEKVVQDGSNGPLVIMWMDGQTAAKTMPVTTINAKKKDDGSFEDDSKVIEGEVLNAESADTIRPETPDASVPRPDTEVCVHRGAPPVREDDGNGE